MSISFRKASPLLVGVAAAGAATAAFIASLVLGSGPAASEGPMNLPGFGFIDVISAGAGVLIVLFMLEHRRRHS